MLHPSGGENVASNCGALRTLGEQNMAATDSGEARRFRSTAVHYLAGRPPYPSRLIARVAALTGLPRGGRVLGRFAPPNEGEGLAPPLRAPPPKLGRAPSRGARRLPLRRDGYRGGSRYGGNRRAQY